MKFFLILLILSITSSALAKTHDSKDQPKPECNEKSTPAQSKKP